VSADGGLRDAFVLRERWFTAGEYTIEAWHERLGTVARIVVIGPRQTTSESFLFSSR